jgi:hypothetical protein
MMLKAVDELSRGTMVDELVMDVAEKEPIHTALALNKLSSHEIIIVVVVIVTIKRISFALNVNLATCSIGLPSSDIFQHFDKLSLAHSFW